MSVNEIITLITNLGYPIVLSVILLKYIQRREDQHDADRKEEQQQHKQEIDKLSEAVNNNTLIMQKLIDKLDKEDD